MVYCHNSPDAAAKGTRIVQRQTRFQHRERDLPDHEVKDVALSRAFYYRDKPPRVFGQLGPAPAQTDSRHILTLNTHDDIAEWLDIHK